MKRILVVDDDRLFPGLIQKDVEFTLAKTEDYADFWMERCLPGGLDEIWLDHDLGGDSTIMPLVKALEYAGHIGAPYPVGQIMVHTVNAPAGDRMMAALSPYYNVRRVGIEELSTLCGAVLL